ncbi:hypothetical protein HMPREF1531_01171 [Propionibacterium sp. oral taxon 192 str. F0372]|uniref:DUF6394 family protein n=1 Tax=Propionibacterium sp. oral taxon 192 TaxID=671222 RepID=UPI000353BA14|nr:DUF6394 family protein [Propionibacterium sp. oral taxon 192]EPH03746.1 hypothetical protein HMPREF1531_01171 [Propionibacterium sp. oral taxon 192 str. F0372]
MNLEKVVFGFFITLAAALNFGFFLGPLDSVHLHNGIELAAALVASFIATILKFGDRTQLGAVHLATSLVADLQLIAAAAVWIVTGSQAGGLTGEAMSVVVSLSGGALLANVVSVVLLVSEIMPSRR